MPTRDELLAAYGKTVPDLVGPGLRVLLVGINPSLWSAWAGYHFARPGNRLWKALHGSGFTSRLLRANETDEILAAGLGITNVVDRATARADELTTAELRAGLDGVRELADRWRPGYVAYLGLSAYRLATGRPKATVGEQPRRLGPSGVWLLPNPSGLNASYQLPALIEAYAALRAAVS